uniref:1,6-anhydro-N-acetylmuramyl-L-alanine amidase AmpD n=1 Tax=Candidatus Kentrum sp. DK TaxID=2126562 RepID=A0A450RYA6_9GAMM|nr:MAG: AmpD protein [Candidatus Kentron sp. DK]VFJ50788.1 MAG: AmpD protein [Candidatus Kentron sp. DK]
MTARPADTFPSSTTMDGAITLDLRHQWLEGVRRLPSPNCDERPAGCAIDLLVIHGISLPPKVFGGHCIDDFFLNRLDPDAHPFFRTLIGVRVSSHLLIDRGGKITQYVPFHKRAWHAGRSRFRERTQCNDFSIGIELEGADDVPYEDVQYRCLARLCRRLMSAWPSIGPDRVVRHSDIAPGRKTDPGECFDWTLFHRQLL